MYIKFKTQPTLYIVTPNRAGITLNIVKNGFNKIQTNGGQREPWQSKSTVKVLILLNSSVSVRYISGRDPKAEI